MLTFTICYLLEFQTKIVGFCANILGFKPFWVHGCTTTNIHILEMTSAKMKMIDPSAKGYSHHHHKIGLIQPNHSVSV